MCAKRSWLGLKGRRECLSAWLMVGVFVSGSCVHALQPIPYDSEVNDRFISGFPTNPVPNTSSSFIGDGFDWSGMAWSTNFFPGTGNHYKGYAMLSPVHFTAAWHYELGNEFTTGIRVLGQDGEVYTQSNQSMTSLGQGIVLLGTNDLALGTLVAPITSPTNIVRYAVLDLHTSSTSTNLTAYTGLEVLLTGRGTTTAGSPRGAVTTVSSMFNNGGDASQPLLITSRDDVELQLGDSGFPAYHRWTNPNGGQELTVLGVNSATGTTINAISFLATPAGIAAANAVMVPDGWAVRVVGDPTRTWQGGSGGPTNRDKLNFNQNWAQNASPSDQYVVFDGNATGWRNLELGGDVEIRGIYFVEANPGSNFVINAGNTLTTGRGGITNYDPVNRQIFSNNVALATHQNWDGGGGGITTYGTIQNNGFLLVVDGQGTNRFEGAISGGGGLTLAGGALELTGANTYTGRTLVAAGKLVAGSATGSATGSGPVLVQNQALLAGSGVISGLVEVASGGMLSPGVDSVGQLTVGELLLRDGALFVADIASVMSYDQVTVTGNNVVLSNALLNVQLSYTPELFEAFTLVKNEGSNPVQGTFLGLDEGATFVEDGTEFQISYLGGDGHDVLITAIPEPASVILLLLAGSAYWIRRRMRSQ